MCLVGCIGLVLAFIVPNVIVLYRPRLFVLFALIVAIALLCWGLLYLALNAQNIYDAWRRRRKHPLVCAAENGDAERVKRLLERGVNVNPRTPEDPIPLREAARKGHTEIVRLLLDHGAVVDARDESGVTPLMVAASLGNRDVVELLIDRGADVNAVSNSGRTALGRSLSWDRRDIEELLRARGATDEGRV